MDYTWIFLLCFGLRQTYSAQINITRTERNDTSISLKWNSVNGTTSYIIQYRERNLTDGNWKTIINITRTQLTITNLHNDTEYEFGVLAKDIDGVGSNITIKTCGVPTDRLSLAGDLTQRYEGVPGANQDQSIVNVILQWKQPGEDVINCDSISQYRVQVRQIGMSVYNCSVKHDEYISSRQRGFDLLPQTEYEAAISIINNIGLEGPAALFNFTTKKGVQPKMKPPRVCPIGNSHQVNVEWQRPTPPHDVIERYDIQYWKAESGTKGELSLYPCDACQKNQFNYTHRLQHLEKGQTYWIRIRGSTNIRDGTWSENVTFVTGATDQDCGASSNAISPNTHRNCSRSVTTPPTHKPVKESSHPSITLSTTIATITEQNLIISPKDIVRGKNTLRFSLPKKEAVMPPVSAKDIKYKLIVQIHKSATRKRRQVNNDLSSAPNYTVAMEMGFNFYVAALLEEHNLGNNFTIGDGKTYGGYFNAPLEKDKKYSVYVGTEAKVNGEPYNKFRILVDEGPRFEVADTSSKVAIEKNLPLIIGVSLGCAVLIVAVIVVAVLYVRIRRRNHADEHADNVALKLSKGVEKTGNVPHYQKKNRNIYDNVPKKAVYYINTNALRGNVEVKNLLNTMKSKTRNMQKKEYDQLSMGLTAKTDVAQYPENVTKNRYKNIVPYDHSRVPLDPVPDVPYSDFINANFIDAYKRPQGYIAAQGPVDITVSDFWRMLWQHSVPVVIMFTKLVEGARHKCSRYWPLPDEGCRKFQQIVVELEEEEVFADYVVRILSASKNGEKKQVTQFHFTSWPDHGVPTFATSVLAFRKKIKSFITDDSWPIVVHCSAGVGRTGTFIALDYLLDQAKAEGKFNILNLLHLMRTQRTKMIQTVEQYYFLHDALLEALYCGETAIPCNVFKTEYEGLKQKQSKWKRTKLELQFEVIQMLNPPLDPNTCKTALSADNIEKNRNKSIVPDSMSRPSLKTIPNGSSEYINGVFIDGFKQKDMFIMTQIPLPHTVADFWCMIYDFGVRTIVVMEDVNLNDESCASYWPDTGSQQYGPIITEVTKVKEFINQFTCRVITVTNSVEPEEQKSQIQLFQLQNWSSDSPVPGDVETLLCLEEEVRKWQQQTGGGRIAVQCMDGASHSGLFCAITNIIEKMKVEQEVDVFQTVKAMKINRPQLVNIVEQYQFCFDVTQKYLDSMDTYANFK